MMVRDGKCIPKGPDGVHIPSNAVPGGFCDQNTRCTGGSICIGNICQCREGFDILGTLCVMRGSFTSGPGGSCIGGERCTGNSYCDGRVCQCSNGTRASGGECIQSTSGPFGNCENGETCTGGSLCDGRLCQCPDGTKAENHVCVRRREDSFPRASPGGACVVDEQCNGGSRCIANVCQCSEGSQVNAAGECSHAVAILPINSACQPGNICAGGSICYQNYCRCPLGTQQRGPNCVRHVSTPQAAQTSMGPQHAQHGYVTLSKTNPVEITRIGSRMFTSPPKHLAPHQIYRATPPQSSVHRPIVHTREWDNNAQEPPACPLNAPPVREALCNATRPDCPVSSFCFASGNANNRLYYCCPAYYHHRKVKRFRQADADDIGTVYDPLPMQN